MYLISTFDHTIHLELALTRLEQMGITRDLIYAVPLSPFTVDAKLFDTIHRSDGVSLLDSGLVCATILTVIGSSYGFVLRLGPIIWGLIGAVIGFLIGFILDLIVSKRRRSKKNDHIQPSVFILVNCDPQMYEKVKEVLKEHLAISYGVIQD